MSDNIDFDGSGTSDDPMVIDGSEASFETVQDSVDQPSAASHDSNVARTIQTSASASAAQHNSKQSDPTPSANAKDSATSLAPAATAHNKSAVVFKTKARPKPAGTLGMGPGNQYLRIEEETFELDPNDTNWLIAHVRMENEYVPGTYYEQEDRIPVMSTSVQSPTNPNFYFIPDLKAAKIPRRHTANMKNDYQPDLWVRQPDSDIWHRRNKAGDGIDIWRPILVFRRFNETTNKYEAVYMKKKQLPDVDPNEKEYQYGYNKWIDQIIRRCDSGYVQVVHKDHWSIEERWALCDAVNDYVSRNGLHRFGFDEGVKMSKEELQKITDRVNAVEGKTRQVDAVRGQIHSSHPRKNKAVFELLARAREMRHRLARGEKISRAERYPDMAIAAKDYPQQPGSKKRSIKEVIDSDSDGDEKKEVVEVDELGEFWKVHGRQPVSKPMQPNKKIKMEDGTGTEIFSDGVWADTDGEILSDAADKAKEEAQWETDDDASSGEDLEGETLFDEDLQDNTPAEITADGSTLIVQDNTPAKIPQGKTTTIVAVSESDSDSDSVIDAEALKAAKLLQHMQKQSRVITNAPAASPQKTKRKRESVIEENENWDGSEASLSLHLKKRKPTPVAETDGSDGDDEKEMSSPFLRRIIKKTRVARV